MRIKIITLWAFLSSMCLCVYASEDSPIPITAEKNCDFCVLLDCDTVVNVDGYSVRIIRDNGEDVFTGLNLFSPDLKESVDKDLLGRIEADLYKTFMRTPTDETVITKIIKGKKTDFKSITPATPCTVKTSNAKNMVVEWPINGKILEVAIPISYETAKGSNRSETENNLIKKIKQSNGKRKSLQIDNSNLETYGENLFILPGGSYQNKNINRNIYLNSELKPVWDAKYPSESIANFFLFPSDTYGDIQMDLTVLKHEYGEKESVSIPVFNVLSEMEAEGCVSYWGVERLNNGILEGALFFFNPTQGYDHVLKIECNPEEVINGEGIIKARASLYIPTNNVDNLNAPYLRKSEKEKIKYEK